MKNRKFYSLLLLIAVCWFLLHGLIIVIDGLNNENQKADFAIILGSTVNEDGSLSDRLKARLDKGVELHKNGLVDSFFVSGGLGKEGFLEGDKMAIYLRNNGIDNDKIFIDNQGNTTILTAKNFKSKFPNTKSIVLVSQYFHLTRCKLAFKKQGYSKINVASPKFFEIRDFYSVFREFFGYYKYLFI